MTIFEQIKGLTKHSAVYTLSTFIQRALGFVLLPVYTSVAYIPDKQSFGDYALVYTFIAFFNIVYLYGMDAAIIRYFFLGRFKREDVYTSAFTGVLTNAIVLSLTIFLLSDWIAHLLLGQKNLAYLIKIVAGILLADSIGNLPYHILRSEERSVVYSLMRIARFFIELALNIVFVVVLRLEVKGILLANLMASLINLLLLLPFQIKYLKGNFSWSAFRTLAAFGLPLLPNGLAYLTVEVSDKILMRILLDKAAVGLYAPNYKFGSLLLLVVMAFRTAWQPFFLKVAKQDNAKTIYARVLTFTTMIGVMIVLLGTFFIEYIVKIPITSDKTIMGSQYWSGLNIIPLILTSYLFYGLYVNFTVGIYINKKTNLMVVFTGLAALVNISSNLYLMPNYNIMGAAIATLLSYMTMAVTLYLANQRIYHIDYDFARLAGLLLYLSAMLLIYYSVDLSFVHRVIILVLTPLLWYALGIIKRNEIRNILSQMNKRSSH
ncbi:MAG: oligosaccharide flippase family protein [Caldithrix sp.]|nr:oligosaccharide flippase family protein [Caldithrix sp.]